MSSNFFKKHHDTNATRVQALADDQQPVSPRRWSRLFTLPLWVFLGFGAASLVVTGIVIVMLRTTTVFAGVNLTILNTVMAAFIYLLSLAIVIGIPWWLRKAKTTRAELGLTRLPSWVDILIAPAGMIVYLLLSGILAFVVGQLIPGFRGDEVQTTGFEEISQKYEYILAFVTLVVIAPLAEEVLFRGYLFGKLQKAVPLWAAVLATSLLFGAVHGQWNLALDTFALSLVLCSLREITGSIWAGVLLHMLKNGLAFYLLFINPTLLHTIGG